VVTARSPTRQSTLFRKRLVDLRQSARHGDLVRVQLPDESTLGYGLFNPRAEATVRMLSWEQELPTAEWWRERLERALQLREALGIFDTGTACRLVHAEGDGLPGLVIDRYDDVLSLEAFSLGMYQRSVAIAKLLLELTDAKHWVVRPGPQTLSQEGFEGEQFGSGKAPERVTITEDGLRFEVYFTSGHKTGFFCDQRENRRRLQALCAGKSVLDLCCYTGGFSLHASAAGASEVTGVDLDEQAIEVAKKNAKLNQAKVRLVHADSFAYMRDMQRNGKTFDVLVLDPPKLIRSREEYEEGNRKYYDFNRLASSLVAPGGMLVTCSCSGLLSAEEFTKTVTAAVPFDRSAQLLQRTGAAPDHPVAMNVPETEYLKCLWLRLNAPPAM
jgi:23S rRNA (cytosine1962-C5)-methyltransferase